MKTRLEQPWVAYFAEKKQQAKDDGRIQGDVDLSVTVSEILEELGLPEKKRQTINAWINGTRTPNIYGFLAICKALGADPLEAIGGHSGAPVAKVIGIKNQIAAIASIVEIASRLTRDGQIELLGQIKQIAKTLPTINKKGQVISMADWRTHTLRPPPDCRL